MKSKTQLIKELLGKNDYIKAINVASKFHDKSESTKKYKRAKSAIENPSFYEQIGSNVDEIISAAKEELIINFTEDV
jgi:maltodextrin utilization protein YvdJ